MRVQGRHASIIRGVSQQPPYDRYDGQMSEMVNFVADPVRGLVRRNGMILRSSYEFSEVPYTEEDVEAVLVHAGSFRHFGCTINSTRFSIAYRSRPRVLPNDPTGVMIGAIRDYPQVLVNTVLRGDWDEYDQGGISSMTAVGEYILIAGNTVRPVLEIKPVWGTEANQGKGVVQVLQGGYSRTYKMKYTRVTGESHEVSYTTMTAEYPETLDVSSVEHKPEDTYQQRLNDVLYGHEGKQSAWRLAASKSIIPSVIAKRLLGLIDGYNSEVHNLRVLTDDLVKGTESTPGTDPGLTATVTRLVKDNETDDVFFRVEFNQPVYVFPREYAKMFMTGSTVPWGNGVGAIVQRGPALWEVNARLQTYPDELELNYAELARANAEWKGTAPTPGAPDGAIVATVTRKEDGWFHVGLSHEVEDFNAEHMQVQSIEEGIIRDWQVPGVGIEFIEQDVTNPRLYFVKVKGEWNAGVDPDSGWIRNGNTLYHPSLSALYAEDSGNSESIRHVFREVTQVSDLPSVANPGMVVRIKPLANSDENYYLIAEVGEGESGNLVKVSWRETAGEIQTPKSIFAVARFVDNGQGVFNLLCGATPEDLQDLLNEVGHPEMKVPTFSASGAGDSESVPAPEFFYNPVSMMTLWQDRLVVAAGNHISMSASGDYFNFWRQSMLTLADNDPVGLQAQGIYGDTLRKAQIYDGNLMLFGDNYHYLIDGQSPMTPTNPRIKVQYSMAGTAIANPQSTGPFVFLLKEDVTSGASSRLIQIRAGVWRDTTDVTDVSMQLRDYVNGTPAEIVALTSPGIVFVRTEEVSRSKLGFPFSGDSRLYTYQYTDSPDGSRLHDAWGAWEWDARLGVPIAIGDNGDGDGMIVFTLAPLPQGDGTYHTSINLMLASARTEPTGLPYLDGMRQAAVAEVTHPYDAAAVSEITEGIVTSPDASRSYIAPDGTSLVSPHQTFGDQDPALADNNRWNGAAGWESDYYTKYPSEVRGGYLWTGFPYSAYVDLTNPFVRDRKDNAVIRGRLTVTRLRVVTTRTAGFSAIRQDMSGHKEVLNWGGVYRLVEFSNSVGIGRDTNNYQVRLKSVDWYPLTINAIEWDGQFFNNGRSM